MGLFKFRAVNLVAEKLVKSVQQEKEGIIETMRRTMMVFPLFLQKMPKGTGMS